MANEAMLTGESVPQIKESLALVDRDQIQTTQTGEGDRREGRRTGER